MIEQIPGRPEGTLEFRISGKVTAQDFENTLTPVFERALERHDQLKLLMVIEDDFEGFDLGGLWRDAGFGLKHWSGFARIAYVTDKDWMQAAVGALGFLSPCPVRGFDLDDLEEARRWLSESLGTIHLRPLGGTALHAELIGKLEPEAYARSEPELDAFIAKEKGLRLLLDLRQFDGWQGLSGLREHLALLRDHHKIPDRVAVVMDDDWVRLAQKVLSRFVSAEIRTYDEDAFEAARAWITGA